MRQTFSNLREKACVRFLKRQGSRPHHDETFPAKCDVRAKDHARVLGARQVVNNGGEHVVRPSAPSGISGRLP